MSVENGVAYPISLPKGNALITLTYPETGLWIIELHNGEDSRLTQALIDEGLRPALDVVEQHWVQNWRTAQKTKQKEMAGGALIIVGKRSQDKFFSNGFDYEAVKGNNDFFAHSVAPLFSRLLTFPIPTIAAINGHAFAAAFMLSLVCDYRIMTDGSKRRAWMCMNEIHFGAPWPVSFMSVLHAKVSCPVTQRRIALEGHRFTPQEAFDAKILDFLVPGAEGTRGVLTRAQELAKEKSVLAQEGAWGSIKAFLYRDCLSGIALDAKTLAVPMPHLDLKIKYKL